MMQINNRNNQDYRNETTRALLLHRLTHSRNRWVYINYIATRDYKHAFK